MHALIVDDNPSNLLVAEFILEEINITTTGCASAKSAFDALKAEQFDFIISDWMMPDMDGIEFLGLIRQHEQHANMPVIICSAKAGDSDKQFALNAGANGYIIKPLTLDMIEKTLKELQLSD